MGMGYGANFADVISAKDIVKICGETANKFFDYFKDKPDGLIDHFAMMVFLDYDDLGYFDNEEEFDKVNQLYEDLLIDFEKKTGLNLELEYHSEDDGDRYDDVVGSYWSLYGIYILSPEAKKLMDRGIIIKRCFYVTFG